MASLDKAGLTYLWSKLKAKLNAKADAVHTHSAGDVSGLAKVATSNSYNDLSNKPTIPTVPTKLSQFSNDKEFLSKTEVQALISALETKIANEYLGGYKWQVGESSNTGKSGYVTVKKP